MMLAQLDNVLWVRRAIGDPITTDIVGYDVLPATGTPGVAYLLTGDGYDGVYHYYALGQWQAYNLRFSDVYIKRRVELVGRLQAAIGLINELIARIDPVNYITGGNAGGQSMTFQTLTEVLGYYNGLKAVLLEQEARETGLGNSGFFRVKRRPVGGVLEAAHEW
jgi:hypothetical protein